MPGRCGTPLSSAAAAAAVAPRPTSSSAAVPSLPLRADVLLSNTLFEELDNGFSEEFLQHYLGTDKLDEAEFLEIQVDTVSGSQRVESIGELLPSLQRLRLNQSLVCSVRDLGTNLQSLRVLWLNRSSLQEVAGIGAMPLLEELYIAFNDVKDLAPLSAHESLKVVDLEGNLVDDFAEVESLSCVASLRELNLSLNPVWKSGDFSREDVFRALPQLEILDDAPPEEPAAKAAAAAATGTREGTEEDAEEDEDEEDDVEVIHYEEFAGTSPAAPSSVRCRSSLGEEMLESRALRELRERSKAFAAASPGAANQKREAWSMDGRLAASGGGEEERGAVAGDPVPLHDGKSGHAARDLAFASSAQAATGSQPQRAAGGEPVGGAVAELHANMAKLRASARGKGGAGGGGANAAPEGAAGEAGGYVASASRNFTAEPTEQDLVVEGLKRAQRPTPVFWKSASARPACTRPALGFFPDRRGLRSAWSSAGSSVSTLYRPATASSELNSSRSTVASAAGMLEGESAFSDLTTGDDGAALVGNPLSACRRRRRIERSQGEDELNIRNLMRFHAAAGGLEGTPWSSMPGDSYDAAPEAPRRGSRGEDQAAGAQRPGTPDIRIRVLSQTPLGCSSVVHPRVPRTPGGGAYGGVGTPSSAAKRRGGYGEGGCTPGGVGAGVGGFYTTIGGAEVLELS